MSRSIKAIIEEDGTVRIAEKLNLRGTHQAILTILESDDERTEENACALLSEQALAQDWDRPEEDAAWSHLQQAQ